MDGIDVALVESDGGAVANAGPASFFPYEEPERALLRAALVEARTLEDRAARPGRIGEAERLVTARHAEAVEAYIREHGVERASVDAVGFHGQTVLHRPERRLTIQIGDGAALAAALAPSRSMAIPVRSSIRSSISAFAGPVSKATGSACGFSM